jgi:hypothetical protein
MLPMKNRYCKAMVNRRKKRETEVVQLTLHATVEISHSAQNAGQAASSAKNLAKERINFCLSSRKAAQIFLAESICVQESKYWSRRRRRRLGITLIACTVVL